VSRDQTILPAKLPLRFSALLIRCADTPFMSPKIRKSDGKLNMMAITIDKGDEDELSPVGAIRRCIESLGGVLLPDLHREPKRQPPDFEQ
jgi:hypothetical protein